MLRRREMTSVELVTFTIRHAQEVNKYTNAIAANRFREALQGLLLCYFLLSCVPLTLSLVPTEAEHADKQLAAGGKDSSSTLPPFLGVPW